MVLIFIAAVVGAAYLLEARRAEIRCRARFRSTVERRLQSLGMS
jgi:hypothetical protein